MAEQRVAQLQLVVAQQVVSREGAAWQSPVPGGASWPPMKRAGELAIHPIPTKLQWVFGAVENAAPIGGTVSSRRPPVFPTKPGAVTEAQHELHAVLVIQAQGCLACYCAAAGSTDEQYL